jgi:acetyltransferase-like isoleucine patch superfamily enzyme
MVMKFSTENLYAALRRLDFLMRWIRWFYKSMPSYSSYVLLLYFFPQKIFRINGRSSWPVHFTSRVLYPDRIEVGLDSAPGMSIGCYIQGRNGIRMGDNVRIGPGAGIISADHDPSNYDEWVETEPIVIGSNVWIGMNAVITAGVTIGDNVIIGANSVVTRDVPDNVVAAGNPCRPIRDKEPYRGVQ